MYLDYFGLSEHPFRITPHTDFFFTGSDRGAILNALLYAAQHEEGIIKVTGEVGSGKSMLCRMLMDNLPNNIVFIYLANPSLNRDEILFAIADDLGLVVPTNARIAFLIRQLQETLVELYSQGKRVLLLVDEAHAMPAESLEEIRLLSNLESSKHKLLQIILFGQQELDSLLNTAKMRPLRERITQHFRLAPLGHKDIDDYINFRLTAAGYAGPKLFELKALQRIVEASQGLARRINILADKSLLAAYTTGRKTINESLVDFAIKDAGYNKQTAHLYQANTSRIISKNWKVLLGLGATLLMAVVGLKYFAMMPTTPSSTATGAKSQTLDQVNAQSKTNAAAPSLTVANSPSFNAEKIHSSFNQLAQRGNLWLSHTEEAYTIQVLATAAGQAQKDRLAEWLEQIPNEQQNLLMIFAEEVFRETEILSVTYGTYANKSEAIVAYSSLSARVKPKLLQIRSRTFLQGKNTSKS